MSCILFLVLLHHCMFFYFSCSMILFKRSSMFIARLSFILISTLFTLVYGETILSKELITILSSLQPFHSQYCQFKFENCIQDSSHADQFKNSCQIYARLRDCYRFLLDDQHCRSKQSKEQYQEMKEKEYQACAQRSRSFHWTSSPFLLLLSLLLLCWC